VRSQCTGAGDTWLDLYWLHYYCVQRIHFRIHHCWMMLCMWATSSLLTLQKRSRCFSIPFIDGFTLNVSSRHTIYNSLNTSLTNITLHYTKDLLDQLSRLSDEIPSLILSGLFLVLYLLLIPFSEIWVKLNETSAECAHLAPVLQTMIILAASPLVSGSDSSMHRRPPLSLATKFFWLSDAGALLHLAERRSYRSKPTNFIDKFKPEQLNSDPNAIGPKTTFVWRRYHSLSHAS